MKRKVLLLLMLLAIGATSTWAQSAYYSYSNISSSYSGSSLYSNGTPTNLLDNSLSSKYCPVYNNDTWPSHSYVDFESNDLIIPTGYVIYTGDDTQQYPGRNPKNWTIQAKVNSNDSWQTIHTVTNAGLPATNKTEVSYSFSNTTAYKYFRIDITAIVSGGIGQLQDFHFIATVQGGGGDSGDSDCEDFNSTSGTSSYSTGGTLPSGWHRIYGGTTETGGTVYDASATSPANMPHVVTNSATTPGAPNSSNYICFYSNSDNTYSYAIMPPVESGAVSHLSFKYKFESTSNGTLAYGTISGTDASTYTVLGTISSPSSNPGTIDVDLNTSQTRGKRIAFRWYKSGTWYTCGIDDVCIETTTIIPYEIYNVADWNDFCAAVNNGHDYSGETVTLENDITTAVTTMAGTITGETLGNAFKGTFDGQGYTLTLDISGGGTGDNWYFTAPFRCIDGATIKNLKTTGTVTQTGGKGAAGLVGCSTGTCTITNCVSNVTINSQTNGDGTHGGFISYIKSGTTTFNGCAFTGSITGSSTYYCAGFVGWKAGSANFNNCVFAPTAITFDYTTGNSANFSRNGGTFNNCYYTQTCGTGWTQGKLMHSITGASGITVANAGTATSYTPETSTIVGYGTGIKFNDILYAANNENVSLNLSGSNTGYVASAGTLTGSGNPYTLAMPDSDVTISKLIIPMTIASKADWENFCLAVNNGHDYSGETVTMTANVTDAVTTMAGSGSNYFRGTFDGQGHTLNVNLLSSTEGCVAPFHYVSDATIKNLKVTGSCVSSASGNTRRHNAGLVGSVKGTNVSLTIENCLVTANVGSTSYTTDYCGGLIGHLGDNTVTIKGSAYTGTLYVSGTNVVGGLIGWGDTPSSVTLTDCFFGGTYNNSSSGYFHPLGVANHANEINSNNISVSNCYYTYDPSDFSSTNTDKPIVCNSTNKGKHAYTITAGSNVTVTNAGTATTYGGSTTSVHYITGYGTGIKYNDELYAGQGDNVSLTLTTNQTGGIFHADNATIAGTSNPYTLEMPNGNVVVQYIAGYNIVTTANPAEGGTMTGGRGYISGESCTVVATANPCYQFVNWTENGTVVSSEPSYTFTVNNQRDLVANFVPEVDANSITVSGNTAACGNTATLEVAGLSDVTYYWYSDEECTNLVGTGATLQTSALYDNTTYYVKAVKEKTFEDLQTFSYMRDVQTYTVPANASSVKLEVWGAQGGSYSETYYGGKGGYAKGTIDSPTPGSTLYVVVGGQPAPYTTAPTSTTGITINGGYNGGGNSITHYYSSNWSLPQGGGGATHIATVTGELSNLSSNQDNVLVVAGGGSGGVYYYSGSYGGFSGYAGGGETSIGYSNTYTANQTTAGNGGDFGKGAAYTSRANYKYGPSGGGGGWYGGGNKQNALDTYSEEMVHGHGGGSGHVNSSLTDAQTIDGNTEFTAPGGGTETGHEGNGYAIITAYIEYSCESEPKAVTVTVTQPAAPTDLAVDNITTTSATASWSGNASSYKWSIDGSNWETTGNTSVNLTGLTLGTDYTFRVKALGTGSCESDEATKNFTTLNTRTLTINYVYAGGGTAHVAYIGQVTIGESYSVNSPAIPGYTPDIATVSGTMPNNDVTETVTYSVNSYNITYTNDGNGTCTGPASAIYGSTVEVTVSPNTGYELATLTYTPYGGSAVDITSTMQFTMPASAVTVSATFSKINYNITYTNDGNGSCSGDATANYGDNVTVTVTPDEGYALASLTYNGTPITPVNGVYAFTMPTSAVTVHATFVAYVSVTYAVSPTGAGTVTYSPAGENYDGGSSSTDKPIGDGTSYDQTYYPMVTNQQNSVSEMIYLSSEIGMGGKIKEISFQYASDDALSRNVKVYLKETSRSSFSGVQWESLTENDCYFNGTVSIDANNAGSWVTITLKDGGFNYSGSNGSNLLVAFHDYTGNKGARNWYYTATESNTCTATWSDGLITPSSVTSASLGMVSKNRPNINLKIAATGGNTVWYTSGAEPTFTATANSGYYFENWTEGGVVVSTDAAYTLEPLTSNRNLTANFVTYKRFTTAGDWNTASNWTPAGVPDENIDVRIEANATISGLAKAKDIVGIADGCGITIEDGGQLWHSNSGVNVTAKKSITGYGSAYSSTNKGYYLFSTPFENLPLSDYHGLVTTNENQAFNHYDWYYFDAPSDPTEWIVAQTVTFLSGYIYANEDNTTISVTGTAKPSGEPFTGNTLAYATENAKRFNGWNLVGNPFVCNAYAYGVDDNETLSQLNYYKLNHNNAGYDEFIADDDRNPIAPMSALMVKATTSGQKVKYFREAQSVGSKGILNMSVTKTNYRGTLDLARIRFGEGEGLPKFQLNPDHTKLYIPMEDEDYAVVYAEPVGEMPVSFKAEENGQYTLTFSGEEVDFSYLHLIDNLTGADVDLLETPYYTFDARTTDYASRFKVVFATGSSTSSDTFAFYSNGTWVIANDGDAILQVVDVTGRVLSSDRISGATSKPINAAPGVYMLRLINGDNVRVQKVVVR